jgi:glycosyltransferase involved in cell wall biosynthesis
MQQTLAHRQQDGLSGVRRILVVNSSWPCTNHTVRAANVVIYELVAEFARQPGLKVGYLKLNADVELPGPIEQAGIRQLSDRGVEFLDPFTVRKHPQRARPARWLAPIESDFYPEVSQRLAAEKAAMKFEPDLIFIPWSEIGVSLFANLPVTKFAYYGNPDPKSGWARAVFAREHGGSRFAYLRECWRLGLLERYHLKTMRRYEYVGDVAANDVEYYRDSGHPNAFYVRNVWIDRCGDGWSDRYQRERLEPFVIIGNIGKLGGTANTHGLEILCRDVLPQLRKTFGRAFEIHICGAGSPHPAIADLLQAPEIRLRGFVEDIDEEMLTAPVFLCLNNASRYKVGHTRYLHAWSLGCCVIAHQDAALSMPEMIGGENCLLGRSPLEIAELIKRAANDVKLRRRIGSAGYATFSTKFRATHVVEQIMSRVGWVREAVSVQ